MNIFKKIGLEYKNIGLDYMSKAEAPPTINPDRKEMPDVTGFLIHVLVIGSLAVIAVYPYLP